MAESSPHSDAAPGVLYFDPNPTTAKLATAGLRLAGYQVFNADTESVAAELCRGHGPAGDGSIVAILLDTATSPKVAASVLRALVQVPGAEELPGILLVSRANPTPIPGAEELPSLKRPFTTPALLKILRETIDNAPRARSTRGGSVPELLVASLTRLIEKHFDSAQPQPEAVEALASELVNLAEIPTPANGVAIQADLACARLESLLQMLGEDGGRGVVTVVRDEASARLHLDRGRLRMAEAHDTEEDLRLGRFIVEAGFMDADALEALAVQPDAKGRPLGVRLVDDGHLQKAEIGQALVDQAREVTCHLLTWDRGQVTFTPSSELHPLAEAAAGEAVELRISDALLEGLRRVDEKAEMGPHMAALDEVWMRVDEEIARRGRHAFTREELGVLELLNGRNNIKEIARKTRTGTFAVSKVLYRLSRSNLARRRLNPVQV
jgi:GNAT superfamily N-acetyltransferase